MDAARAQATSVPWFRKLPELGSAAQFAALRHLLIASNYTEAAICERLHVEQIQSFCSPPPGGRRLEDVLDVLVALFFDGSFVNEEKIDALLPSGSAPLLDSLGLLTRDGAPEKCVFATAAILPAFGVLSLCDRAAAPDGSDCELPPDVVFPAISETGSDFIRELPEGPCDALLDLGTGSGVAALLGARLARHVWATDVTPRAVRFAEFSRRLAGAENMTVLEGDLYAPVQGLTFDRILIHPPYVPLRADRQQLVCADAGDDGEQIIRRTIEGLAGYLRPGGRFYSLQMTGESRAKPFEERIRRWLGPSQGQFDLLLAMHAIRTKLEFQAGERHRGVVALEGTRYWLGLSNSSADDCLIHAGLLIERHAHPRAAVTHRLRESQRCSGRDLEWQLEWHQALIGPDSIEMLMSSRPCTPAGLELHVVSRLHERQFRASEYRIEATGAFETSLHCEAWMAELLPECDGTLTWREHFERLKTERRIRPDVPDRSFADLLGLLVSRGILQLPERRRGE